MIKFFRKIRYDLMEKNKTGKYLKYAIGEIVLVVIGILIALQINNWSEDRKKDLLEISVLKELKRNLTDDIKDINANTDFHKRALVSSKVISNVMKNQLPYNDSLDTHFTSIFIVPLFLETRTAYGQIKNIGTSLVKTDSLREQIVDLYERKYYYLKNWVESERRQSSDDIHGLYRNEFSSIDFFGGSHPINYEKLIKNQVYINYVNHNTTLSEYTLRQYNISKQVAGNIIKMIDLELDK
jgi:hypothetical protein